MAYFSDVSPGFLYLHGGFAILIYLLFYKTIFGIDEVKWMFINALLGILGLYSEIGTLLSWAGKDINSFPLHIHIIPFLYYILYTFLFRQIFIEVTNSREDRDKKERVSYVYLIVSTLVYLFLYIVN